MGMDHLDIYTDALEVYKRLSDAEFGRASRAALRYLMDGTEEDLSGKDSIMYDALCRQVDLERVRCAKRNARNRENGSKGGRPRKTQNNRLGFSETQNNRLGFLGFERKEKESFPPAPPIKEKDKEPPVGASPTATAAAGFLSDEEAAELQEGIGAVLDEAEKCGFPRNERTFDRLNLLCAEFTAGWVMRALDQTVESAHGAPSVALLRAILERYKRQGGPDGKETAAQEEGTSPGYLYEPDLKNPRIWESGDGS